MDPKQERPVDRSRVIWDRAYRGAPEPAREAMNRACAEIEAQARRTEIMMIKTVAPAARPAHSPNIRASSRSAALEGA
jgi:hypothetical protein